MTWPERWTGIGRRPLGIAYCDATVAGAVLGRRHRLAWGCRVDLAPGVVVGGRVVEPRGLAAGLSLVLSSIDHGTVGLCRPTEGLDDPGLDRAIELLADRGGLIDRIEPVERAAARLVELDRATTADRRAARYVARSGWRDLIVDADPAGVSVRTRPRAAHIAGFELRRGDHPDDPGGLLEPFEPPRGLQAPADLTTLTTLAAATALTAGTDGPLPS